MALEDIFRALEEQAEQECERILADARDHADAILVDAQDQASELRDTKVGDAERVVRSKASQKLNSARLENKKRVAAVKEEAVRAAFGAALQKLAGVRSSSDYPAIFKALLQEAVGDLTGELEVRVDPADEVLVGKVLAELGVSATVSPTLSTSGGVVVATHGGRILRRNTLEDRLDKVTQLIGADVAEIMFS